MKNKNRSELSLSKVKSETQYKEEVYIPPLDVLRIKVLELRVPDEDSKLYCLKITFFDQLLVSNVISSSSFKECKDTKVIARGYMNYDPSDYEKMCLFADSPLTVKIYPYKTMEKLSSTVSSEQSQATKTSVINYMQVNPDTYCCNIDILPIFIDKSNLSFKQRLEPVVKPSVLHVKSWDNLPEINLCVESIKNIENTKHQKIMNEANYMTMTLVGCYNTIEAYNENYVYTAATKMPLENDMHSGTFTFCRGAKVPKRFNSLSFYPHWESLRLSDDPFPNGNKKMQVNATEIQNEDKFDIGNSFNKINYTIIWASFHRTLMLRKTEKWLQMFLRKYQWPLEIEMCGESHSYSFMGFLDLFKLLYPGENAVTLVIPLQLMDRDTMMTKCHCTSLLHNNENLTPTVPQKLNKSNTDSTTFLYESALSAKTSNKDGNTFVIVEVSLRKPFMKPVIPAHISNSDINNMLEEMASKPTKRKCEGRGQLDYNWQDIVLKAANSLRRIPYYGLPDLCSLNRQLSGSRVRVEMMTSFWQEAAIYVNNNFVVSDFLQSESTFEELITIAHACLMRITSDTLWDAETEHINTTLRAARHARQLQDLPHATQLYLQLIVEGPREANSWRELATCLKELNREWANACINKSIMLNPRHPLSLLSKGCMVLEEDPDGAEPFFIALLALYPFWTPMCVSVSAYYLQRELFHMANAIIEQVKKAQAEGLSDDIQYPRSWEHELGDWWDNTPLLPGTNLYFDAADLLLRIRAISLAEVCVARALTETGESPVYYHLVALCCRLRGHIEDALCHLQQGIEKFGEISYIRSLQGECFHKLKDTSASMASFNKIKSCGSYTALLSFPRKDYQRNLSLISDVVRRYPSAYAWMTFADYWIMRSVTSEGNDAELTDEQKTAKTNAISCLFKALQYDRRIGRAWGMLATLVKPRERRHFCKEMAAMYDYTKPTEQRSRHLIEKGDSLYNLGKAIRECYCEMCENLSL